MRGQKKHRAKHIAQMVRMDLRNGIWRRWYCFVLMVPMILYLCVTYRNLAQALYEGNHAGIWNYFAECFRGCPPVDLKMGMQNFPIFYLVLPMALAILSAFYAAVDLEKRGTLVFLAAGDRTSWWIGKGIWNAAAVVLYFLVIDLTIFLTALVFCRGELVWNNPDIVPWYEEKDAGNWFFSLIVLPICASAALHQIVMTISVMTRPIYGFFGYMIVLCASIFVPWLPGNYLMYERMSISSMGSVTPGRALVCCLVLWAAGWMAGLLWIKRKDMI